MEIKVGVLGNGLVGKELLRLIEDDKIFSVSLIGVKSITDRDEKLFTADLMSIANDPSISIIIDTLPGIEPSESISVAALINNKIVISCNKELWSMSGNSIIEAAEAHQGLVWLNSLVCSPKATSPIKGELTSKTIRSFLPEAIYCFRGGSHHDAARYLYSDMMKAIGY